MTDFSRRQVLALGGAAGAAAFLGACGGGETVSQNTSGKAELRVWFMQDSVSEKGMEWLKKTFEDQNPGSTLKYEMQVWEGIVAKLQTALTSPDATPDVIEFGNTQVPTFAAIKALTDLSDMKEELGGADLTESLVELGSYDGKMYAAPFYAGSRLFIYRKDMFEAAGVEPPKTIDELTEVATKIQKKRPSKAKNFSALQLPGISAQSCFTWVFSNGGRLATLEGDKWKGGLSSPEAQNALKQLQAVWKTGSTTAGVTDSDIASKPYLPMNQDECAMFLGFNFHVKKLDPKLVDAGKIGYFSFPPQTGDEHGHPFAGGSNVGISAKSKNQELAKKVMKLIFAKEFQESFAKDGGWVPGNLKYAAALGDDELSKLTVEAVKYSVGTPAAERWAQVEAARVVDDFFVAIAAMKDPVAEAAAADKKMEELLNA